jgi:hypothetical protein
MGEGRGCITTAGLCTACIIGASAASNMTNNWLCNLL